MLWFYMCIISTLNYTNVGILLCVLLWQFLKSKEFVTVLYRFLPANGSDKNELQVPIQKSSTSRVSSSSSSSTQKPTETTTTTIDLESTWSTTENESSSDESVTESIYTDSDYTQNNAEITSSQGTTSTVAPSVCVVMGEK